MDMGQFRRGRIRAPGSARVRIDYCVFVATLQALQLATATARAESRCGGDAPAPAGAAQPLAEILLGREDWQDAVLARGGCFNPAFAHRLDED